MKMGLPPTAPNNTASACWHNFSVASGNGVPVSEQLAAEVFSLPMHAYLDEATQDRIIVNYPNVRQFNPNRDATRAEVSAMVYQTLVRDGRVASLNSQYIVNA